MTSALNKNAETETHALQDKVAASEITVAECPRALDHVNQKKTALLPCSLCP